MNESDTERISGQLEELGYVPADILDDADVVTSEYLQYPAECRRESIWQNWRGKEIKGEEARCPFGDCRMHGAGK